MQRNHQESRRICTLILHLNADPLRHIRCVHVCHKYSERRQRHVLLATMAMCRGGVAHDNRNGVGTRATPGARDRSPGNMWSHGTTLNVFSGGALGGSDRASIRGGAFGWEIQPWFGLEGSATWIGWDKSAHAFTPAMTAQLGLFAPDVLESGTCTAALAVLPGCDVQRTALSDHSR